MLDLSEIHDDNKVDIRKLISKWKEEEEENFKKDSTLNLSVMDVEDVGILLNHYSDHILMGEPRFNIKQTKWTGRTFRNGDWSLSPGLSEAVFVNCNFQFCYFPPNSGAKFYDCTLNGEKFKNTPTKRRGY